ncbi:EcoAI/FtnUII family type I restriction enzme subunit R [Sansalvadorimonas verongulae]|uniref:EcoAI/FtnUII family type I restriction enzme subunit R n=1 Tax=Sansalvadorimonas verongulae TaxID=2172824 RepID=UPI0018AD0FB9|nr:DEAD/DEAH box helicase family protein [Sansalvadorimonas verongulae]
MESKRKLTERDICTKFITPAIQQAGWDIHTQIREEVTFTAGRIIVRGKLHTRGKKRRADYVLYHQKNQPIAIIEAKDNKHSLGAGMQQGLAYADALDVPFIFSSNGDGFLFHDRTGQGGQLETELTLDEFPSPEELWRRYCAYKGLDEPASQTVSVPYYDDGSGRTPRYYQANAINRTVEAVAKGQKRALLVMATGTGKTYTAFQIIWRLWKSKSWQPKGAGKPKRILFLADRNILVDQTKNNDFKPFGSAMTKISKRKVDKSYEVYLSLYQAVTGNEEEKNIYKQFSPDFFDLIVIDECHRGSAREDSAWREILEYFSAGTHIGLTATPKETEEVSNIDYFGKPIYCYSLKQGIEDGFLAPYKVVRVDFDIDLKGWRPRKGQIFTKGQSTEHTWYYEHPYPAGYKNYSKTRPMKFEEFKPEMAWWGNEEDGFASREQNEQAWKVSIDEIKARNYNLDIKNPHISEQVSHNPNELLQAYADQQQEMMAIRQQLKDILGKALNPSLEQS